MTRYADAQHEAAHAVVGVYLGLQLRRVELCPGPDPLGLTHFGRMPRSKRLHFGVAYAAGPAADALSGLDEPEAWRGDYALIDDLGYSKLERRLLIDAATSYLRGPCSKPWRAVTEELLARSLSGREVRALVILGDREALVE